MACWPSIQSSHRPLRRLVKIRNRWFDSSFLSEQESPGSIAFISSVGQIGSLVAPALFGYVSDRTGSLTMGASVVAGVLIAGGCAVLNLRFRRPNQG
jgi:MFS family permease